jgi:hypothetical protein
MISEILMQRYFIIAGLMLHQALLLRQALLLQYTA